MLPALVARDRVHDVPPQLGIGSKAALDMTGFTMTSILMIIIGIVMGGWAARANSVPESQRPIILQGPVGGLIKLVSQVGGLGLLIFGVIRLFS